MIFIKEYYMKKLMVFIKGYYIKRHVILVVSFYYILFFISFSLICAIAYYMADSKDNTLLRYIFFSCATSVGHTMQGFDTSSDIFNAIQIVHKFIIGISFPIFTSFIFYYITNVQPEIIFPNILLIRKNSESDIVLSILIGNKEYERNGYYLYDIECKVRYSFAVDKTNRYRRNAKTKLESSTNIVIGFYRFSFLLSGFPTHFIDTILTQDNICLQDTLIFTISGKFGPWRSNFIVSKKYTLNDVYIAKDNKEIYKKIECLGKTKEIFIWKNMNEMIHYSKRENDSIKDEIQKIYREKKYTHIILP